MTKRKIQIIIGLMCVAMIGLVALQWYWIREAKAIRNDQFNHKVAESVQEVVHRLEKQEMRYLLQQRIDSEQQKNKLDRIAKLRNTPVKKSKPAPTPANRKPTQKPSPKYAVIIGPHGEEIHYEIVSEQVPTDALSPNFRIMADFQQQIVEEFFDAQRKGAAGMDAFIRRRLDDERTLGKVFSEASTSKEPTAGSPAERAVSPKAGSDAQAHSNELPSPKISQEPDKVALLRDVMQDLLYTKRPIHERVNRFLLDTLLRKELNANGIDIPFEFAVQDAHPQKFIFATARISSTDWQTKSYKAALFPNEMAPTQNLLMVYFPDQEKYILSNMGVLFGGSGTLILVVMGCFYLAVSTIIRQKKMSDIKTDFINNMTHELKTPISTIGLAVDMAHEVSTEPAPPKMSRYLGIIQEENKRLGVHVEKVLQMAMLEKGEVRLERKSIPMQDLISQALNSLSMQIEKRDGKVDLAFEADHDLVYGDEIHLLNILKNLLDNAIKYSPNQLLINIQTSNKNNGIQIVIQDEGVGLKKEQLSRIFETFYRVPTGDVHDVKGFGLGLSYVRKMVLAHQGTIQVQSKLGQGSTFTLWFPTAMEA
ncbi:two-component system phosphate regulon sensor histidine kinase PhoR [Dyadobacter jejuensis]|uniref:histidine kinase n=1 Tax=Dyadobacter jejuensis TaxID=1082580 RepID=A0A316ARK2_9BACT|nr:HAMP domain-containing sensor histidine kinase [Dyadobacter jejuensis]PWJ59996.1 two-component system phosphate regulon sensor histidine kinase PhoR [Dyadobacter jejuensis]